MTIHTPIAEHCFDLEVACGAPVLLGSRNGARMMMIPITGGAITGPRLQGEVMAGGADWAEAKDDGSAEVNARYSIKASDGTIIQVFNGGPVRFDPKAEGPPPVILTTPRFIAPEGPHGWLNDGVFVGTLNADPANMGVVKIGIFKMA